MLHSIFAVLHASSALCALHVSIPAYRQKTLKHCPALKQCTSLANLRPVAPQTQQTQWSSQSLTPPVRPLLSWVHSVNPTARGCKGEMPGNVEGKCSGLTPGTWEGTIPESLALAL